MEKLFERHLQYISDVRNSFLSPEFDTRKNQKNLQIDNNVLHLHNKYVLHMETTTNFSIRTKKNTLKMFDSIISRQNLSRNRVIEDFMIRYIEKNQDEAQKRYCLKGDLAKYKGIAANISKDDVLNDPRAKHALGYK